MQQQPNQNNEISLRDFYQAVVLKTVGFALLRVQQGEEKFCTFVFDDPDLTANTTLDQYWNGQVQVDAKALITNIRELKQRLYSRQQLAGEY